MSNVLTDVGHDVKVGVEDTAKAVIKVVDFLPHAAAVLSDALKAEPQLKTTVLNLITAGSKVVADGTVAVVADKGANRIQDAATVTDAESFFSYVKSTFIPEVAALFKEVKQDSQGVSRSSSGLSMS